MAVLRLRSTGLQRSDGFLDQNNVFKDGIVFGVSKFGEGA